MRKFINIIQEAEEPAYGAGEPVTVETVPAVLYHGTGPITGAAIVKSHNLAADFPVDDDDLGSVVCVTSKRSVAKDFAIEYERFSSPYEVGIIFEIDGKSVARIHEIVPYHAETASTFEYEYRVKGDIPFNAITAIHVVGEDDLLYDESFIEQMWNDPYGARALFGTFDNFHAAIMALRDRLQQ